MENGIVFRKAYSCDLEILLQFEQEIVYAERPIDKTLKDETIHYYDIAAIIQDQDMEVIVAELKGNIIASRYARI